MRTCPSCSAENADRETHCSACGASLNEPEDVTRTLGPEQAASSAPTPTTDTPSDAHHGRLLPGTRIADRYRVVVSTTGERFGLLGALETEGLVGFEVSPDDPDAVERSMAGYEEPDVVAAEVERIFGENVWAEVTRD